MATTQEKRRLLPCGRAGPDARRKFSSKAVSCSGKVCLLQKSTYFAELCLLRQNLSVAGAFLQGRVCSPAKHACCRRMFFRRAVHGSEKSASSRRVFFAKLRLPPEKSVCCRRFFTRPCLLPGKACLLQACVFPQGGAAFGLSISLTP